MTRWITRGCRIGFVFVMCFCLAAYKVEAFQVTPAIIDLSMAAGSSTQQEMIVRNTDYSAQTYFLTVQKFIAGGGGRPQFLDPKDIDGLPSWIRVTQPEFTLNPGEEKRIRAVIEVPKDAPSGGAYAAIFVTEKPTPTTPVGVSKRIGSLVLLAVNQAASPAKIVVQKWERRTVYSAGWKRWLIPSRQEKVSILLKNQGGVHGMVAMETRVVTWGLTGKHANEFSQAVRLLPGELRTVTFDWQSKTPLSIIKVETKLNGVVQPGGELEIAISLSMWIYLFLAVSFFGGWIVFQKRRRHSGESISRTV